MVEHMKDNRKTIQVLAILTLIFAIAGGTLAYWQWTTAEEQETKVVFTITQDFSCSADGGGNITQNDVKLAPTSCTDTSRAIKRKVTVTPTLDRNNLTVSLDLWLNVHELGEGLKKSNNFRYVLTTSSNSCEEGEIISEGNFKGIKTGDKIPLIANDLHTVTPTPEEYYLYIWLDAEETNSNTMNQRFNLSLGGVCDEVETLKGDAYAILTANEEYNEYYDLTFVRSETTIKAGDTYNGKIVKGAYSGFEEEIYTAASQVPWYSSNTVIANVTFEDTIRPISTAYWFVELIDYETGMDVQTALTVDISKLDTSQVTDMRDMFNMASYWRTLYLVGMNKLNTEKVTNMKNMFASNGVESSNGIQGLDFTNWDTSNVTDMSGMFIELGAMDRNQVLLGIENINTSKVTNASRMFWGTGINTLNVSEWNVANMTNMSGMFSWTTLGPLGVNKVVGLEAWDTSSVINMSGMFSSVNYTQEGPEFDGISNWDVSNVTDMSSMFEGNGYVNNDLSKWNVSNVTNMSYMFQRSVILPGFGDISGWNTSNVTAMSGMFKWIMMLEQETILDLSNWDVSNVTKSDDFYIADGYGYENETSITPPNFG